MHDIIDIAIHLRDALAAEAARLLNKKLHGQPAASGRVLRLSRFGAFDAGAPTSDIARIPLVEFKHADPSRMAQGIIDVAVGLGTEVIFQQPSPCTVSPLPPRSGRSGSSASFRHIEFFYSASSARLPWLKLSLRFRWLDQRLAAAAVRRLTLRSPRQGAEPGACTPSFNL